MGLQSSSTESRLRREFPECPPREDYQLVLSPRVGRLGSTATVSGWLPVMAKDGTYRGQTSDRVLVWWNPDPPLQVFEETPRAGGPGPVLYLSGQNVAGICTFQVVFTVPNVSPGSYPVVVIYGGPDVGGRSFAAFEPVTFEVTA